MSSNLFDSIRIKRRRGEKEKPEGPICEWEGCEKPGTHKAPKTKKQNGDFHTFCIEHVREYNKSFNYFSDMKDEEVGDVIRQAARTGERPTWGMGTNAHGRGNPRPRAAQHTGDFATRRVSDPNNFFARVARNQGRKPMTPKEKKLLVADRRALETLGLEGAKSSDEIKAAYKDLVKKHHPDANGGDRSSEDRLRAIITAYNHLKQKGFVETK